jgi:DNA invertase Pin-like site-specific DNA recombinase
LAQYEPAGYEYFRIITVYTERNNRPSGQEMQAEQRQRRAAMYVRMSTDHQKYSTENQAAAIEKYAGQRNITIVATYADEGKSGLTIDNRDSLKRLIADVQSGKAGFEMILVLDVTRWGRFQDADESAYHEYICRNAGMDVQYVAEQFENDGSPVSNIIKSVKRSMAGEYSRELSNKVFSGQCRLIELGFRQGGTHGYGLRRMLVDEHGAQKHELQPRERKSFPTDRVVLVPGPPEEVETTRWIYKAFTEQAMNEGEIAGVLNRRGIITDLGRPWTRETVHQVLTNEKYIGHNVFNRHSFKLKKRHVVNPPDMWVRKNHAFAALVEPEYFYAAQQIILERSRKLSDNDMLDKLKSLQERHGWLSAVVIDEAEDMPTSTAYAYRFGSLTRAYQLIGYASAYDTRFIEINRRLRKVHAETLEDTICKIQALGGTVQRETAHDLLTVNETLSVSIVICRCYEAMGGSRWTIRLDASLLPDITIAVRMDESNQQPLDYYLLPGLDIEQPRIRLSERQGLTMESYRFDDLETFFLLTENVALQEVA